MTRRYDVEFDLVEHHAEEERAKAWALLWLRKGWRIKEPLTLHDLGNGRGKVTMLLSDTEGNLPTKESIR
jgi:hypothetical protein